MIQDRLAELARKSRQDAVKSCAICRGSGVIIVDPGDATPQGKDCQCLSGWRQQGNLIMAGIPKEYWGVEGFNFEGLKNKHAIEAVMKYVDEVGQASDKGLGIYMSGDVDAGKTTLGCYILAKALGAGFSAFYVTVERLMIAYFELMGKTGDERGEADQELRWIESEVQFLLLDEIGKEAGSDASFARSKLDYIIRGRIANQLPTILIGQMSMSDLKQKYGETLFSILTGQFKHITFMTEGFRKQQHKTWGERLNS